MMTIDKDTILKIMPNAPADRASALASSIAKYGAKYGIDNQFNLAAFLATLAVESNQLRSMVELTGYYTNKSGKKVGTGKNASYAPYYGRGPIQLTNPENYLAFSLKQFGDKRLVDNPDLVSSDLETGMASAMWFWKVNNIYKYASKGDIDTVSGMVNYGPGRYIKEGKPTGKINGLTERRSYYSKAIDAMKKKIYQVKFKGQSTYSLISLWNYLSHISK